MARVMIAADVARSRRVALTRPLGTAALVGGIGLFLASPDRRVVVPPCPFKAATGIDCPGCGAARSLVSLSELDPLGALDHNLLVPIAGLALVVAWASWFGRALGHRVPSPLASPRASIVVLTIVVAFWALRLVPLSPFDLLASDRAIP